MRRFLLTLLTLLALALFVAVRCAPDGTPRVERDEESSPTATTRKPQVQSVEPKNAPVELQVAPLDQPVAGPCSMLLVLSDESGGAPVASTVDLYRLDIPENEYWSRGDRFQVQVRVPKQGVWIRELPAARYRITIHEQRFGSDDPVAFGVEGAETRVSLPVPLPQEFEAYLVVRSASGERVMGEGRGEGGCATGLAVCGPAG